MFSLLINAVILLLSCLVLILFFTYIFFLLDIIFSIKHYLDLYITDTALKVSRSLNCFTTFSQGVEKYFPRLWGMAISDGIFFALL